ncbi:MAG: pilus assembly protein TadG-related protein [Anaerolineae bacterium]
MNEDKQPGQSIILVAIMLVAIVAMAALAVDMTNVYFERRTAQNAADAAALAGAEDLAWQLREKKPAQRDSWPIKAAMNDLAERNGIADTHPDNEFLNYNVDAYYLTLDVSSGSLVRDAQFPVGEKYWVASRQ